MKDGQLDNLSCFSGVFMRDHRPARCFQACWQAFPVGCASSPTKIRQHLDGGGRCSFATFVVQELVYLPA